MGCLGPDSAYPFFAKDALLRASWTPLTRIFLRGAANGGHSRGGLTRALALLLVAKFLHFCLCTSPAHGGDVEFPLFVRPTSPVTLSAERGRKWRKGDYDVWLLSGQCVLQQGSRTATAERAVVWVTRESDDTQPLYRVIAYLEGNVSVTHAKGAADGEALGTLNDRQWLTRLSSGLSPLFQVKDSVETSAEDSELYRRAYAMWSRPSAEVRPVQLQRLLETPPSSNAPPVGTRRIRLSTRSGAPVRALQTIDTAAQERIVIVDGGVILVMDGLEELDLIDVETDRLVLWIGDTGDADLTSGTTQSEDVPLEFYLEGNIIFRQGERIIRAERMYYDARRKAGVVLDSELLTPIPEFEGKLRLRADVLRQLNENRFQAQNAMVTSSRLGVPSYWLRARDVELQDEQTLLRDPATGVPVIDPAIGTPVIDHRRLATSRQNVAYIGGVPVFYWPVLATDLEDPTFYLKRIRLKSDNIFGQQILTDWDAFELFGIRNPPPGLDWELSADYLSERGFGFGTSLNYIGTGLLGLPGPYSGFADAWAINEQDVDTLGNDRMGLVPEEDFRGRVLARHRQQLPWNLQFSGELGWISDRNFLEQYYENEWDEFKDQSTGIELKRIRENRSLSLTTDVRINDFFTQTEWLPRADHFWLGQPLIHDTLTWFAHTHVGYGRLRTADTPTDPRDAAKFALLPWEVEVSGERAVTRQEIDLPFSVGPVRVVPYALGELAHWGEDITGEDLQRAYGQAGVRASMPMWTALPHVEDPLWNLHGLAHKMVWDAEFAFADANRDLTQLPLYDPLDDDSVEHFRRRTAFNTFGMVPIPLRFDERFYALRSGIGSWVTSPATEVADDITFLRAGLRQRWQTKRGLPGRRRIIDWIILDTQAVWFPKPADDNFGEDFGLATYDFRWHVGDRVTLVSDGAFDFFDQGQEVVTFGGFLNRPPRGSLYLGFRSLRGPFNSQIVTGSWSYLMSPKWISTFGTSVDLADAGNIGQNFSITRIGEAFIFSFGFNVDANKDNVGVKLEIQPRFLSAAFASRFQGAQIPVAGQFGLD